jgi:hypothetical protein
MTFVKNTDNNSDNYGNHEFNTQPKESKIIDIKADQILKYPDNIFAYAASFGAINALRIMLISDPTTKCILSNRDTSNYNDINDKKNMHSSTGFYYGHNKFHSNPLSYAIMNNHIDCLRYLLTTTFSCLSNYASVENLKIFNGIENYGEITIF